MCRAAQTIQLHDGRAGSPLATRENHPLFGIQYLLGLPSDSLDPPLT